MSVAVQGMGAAAQLQRLPSWAQLELELGVLAIAAAHFPGTQTPRAKATLEAAPTPPAPPRDWVKVCRCGGGAKTLGQSVGNQASSCGCSLYKRQGGCGTPAAVQAVALCARHANRSRQLTTTRHPSHPLTLAWSKVWVMHREQRLAGKFWARFLLRAVTKSLPGRGKWCESERGATSERCARVSGS